MSGKAMVNFTIRLTEEELTWLKAEADRQLRPVSSMLRWIIAEYRSSKTENEEM